MLEGKDITLYLSALPGYGSVWIIQLLLSHFVTL